jgi:hypothetical protein
LKEEAGEIRPHNPHPIMNLFHPWGGVGKERGVHGVVGDQTQKKKNSHSDQKNPDDLMLQLFFD